MLEAKFFWSDVVAKIVERCSRTTGCFTTKGWFSYEIRYNQILRSLSANRA